MDQGLITDPKALERMTHELESLERRITTLEDEELEVMARLEDAQRSLDEVAGELTSTAERVTGLRSARDARAVELDTEAAAVRQERAGAVEGVAADLLALYEKLREAKSGVGVGELRRGECGGCRLTLNAAALREIAAAPADEVVRCEECQRILVRTPESGLRTAEQ